MELFNNFFAFDHFAENNMLSIEPRALDKSDEELRTVGVGTSICHREEVGLVMFKPEIFVFKLVAIDGFTSSTVLVGEVASLSHKVSDNSMERRSLISESFFSSTESLEVGGGLGDDWVEKFEDNSSSGGASDADVKEYFGHGILDMYDTNNIQIVSNKALKIWMRNEKYSFDKKQSSVPF